MRFVGPEGGFGCGGGSDDGESLSEGAHEEDCGLRFLEHFWDADTDEGFGNSDDAYRHAEEMYREAVGLDLAGDRPSAWYRLGRVIHLLQDPCNPAHGHLDPHGAADPDNDFEQRADELFEQVLDDGELEPAELVFEARQSAAGPLLSALVPDTPLARRCSSGTLPVAAREGTLVLGCLPGDVDGDGLATLADLLASRGAAAAPCADLAPSTRGCSPPSGAAARCPAGDGSFDDEDRAQLRALVAGVERASCESCNEPGEGALLRLPGDVAPAGGGDGRLGVADVLRVLRFAVGLETPTGEERLRAEVDGEGRLDVSDVVLVLRAAVQLVELVWPERELVLEFDRPRTLSAWSILVSGLPPWARTSSSGAAGCPAGPFGGLDAAGGLAGVTCAPAGPVALSGRIAVLRYRAPEPVEPGRLSVTARALDAAGAQVAPEVSVGLP